jgi:hypothetical protein
MKINNQKDLQREISRLKKASEEQNRVIDGRLTSLKEKFRPENILFDTLSRLGRIGKFLAPFALKIWKYARG